MNLADIQRVWHDAFRPPVATDRPAAHGASPPPHGGSAARSVKWRLLAAREHATPGFMTLRAVRDNGRLVDFAWDYASASAVRLLNLHGPELRGMRLRAVLGHEADHPALFDQYRRVVDHGARQAILQVHVVNGVNDTFRHGAVRLGDGVAVTLTNLSAVRRERALQLEFTAQHGVTPAR